MPLTVQTEFNSDDIKQVKRLDPNRPVFLLVGAPGQHIVIKRDMTPNPSDRTNMAHAIRNMKAVDPTIASKALTKKELNALHQFAEIAEIDAGLSGRELPQDVAALRGFLDQGTGPTWLKMNKLEGIVNLESAALAARGANADKAGVREIAEALSRPGGLEKLGSILAVDLFNGNNDRFSLGDQGQPEARIPGHQVDFQRMTNIGNVVLCVQNNVLRPVGLDAYAGMSEFRDLSENKPPPREWPGYKLADSQKQWRRQFAEEVAADIEAALGPRNRKRLFVSTKRLPSDAGARIAAGIDQGITALKVKLLQMYSPQTRPPGLLQRMIALGWAIQRVVGGVAQMQPAPPAGLPPRR